METLLPLKIQLRAFGLPIAPAQQGQVSRPLSVLHAEEQHGSHLPVSRMVFGLNGTAGVRIARFDVFFQTLFPFLAAEAALLRDEPLKDRWRSPVSLIVRRAFPRVCDLTRK